MHMTQFRFRRKNILVVFRNSSFTSIRENFTKSLIALKTYSKQIKTTKNPIKLIYFRRKKISKRFEGVGVKNLDPTKINPKF